MRGEDLQQHDLFSYGSLEERIPADHPLRPIRTMVDQALNGLDTRFDEIYGEDGRRWITPERLLRALLVQMFYSVRSERMLMEQLEIQPVVPVVCRVVIKQARMASDSVHEEPGPAAERSRVGGVLHAGGRASAQCEAALR